MKFTNFVLPFYPQTNNFALLDENVWFLDNFNNKLIVINIRSKEFIKELTLISKPIAIVSTGENIWVSTETFEIIVFDSLFKNIFTFQSGNVKIIKFFNFYNGHLFTISDNSNLVKWNVKTFSLEQTFFGKKINDVIVDVCPSIIISSIFILSEISLNVYTYDGNFKFLLNIGGKTIINIPGKNLNDEHFFIACEESILVYKILGQEYKLIYTSEISIPGVINLIKLYDDRILATLRNGQISLINSQNFTILYSVQPHTHELKNQIPFSFISYTTIKSTLWTLSGNTVSTWDENYISPDLSEQYNYFLHNREIEILQKNINFKEYLHNLYQEKITEFINYISNNLYDGSKNSEVRNSLNLLNENFWNDIRTCNKMKFSITNKEQSNTSNTEIIEIIDYWKNRFEETKIEKDKFQNAYNNLSNFLALEDSENQKKAKYLCDLIKENTTLNERCILLLDELSKVRSKIQPNNCIYSDIVSDNNPINIDLKEQNDTLNKLNLELSEKINSTKDLKEANIFLKDRIASLNSELEENQKYLENQINTAKKDISSFMKSLKHSEKEMERIKRTLKEKDEINNQLKSDNNELYLANMKLNDLNVSLSEKLSFKDNYQDAIVIDLKKQIEFMCESINEKTAIINDLEISKNDLKREVNILRTTIVNEERTNEYKNEEINLLRDEIGALEKIINEQKKYGTTISNLHCRIEQCVEDIRVSLDPLKFSSQFNTLDDRLKELYKLESDFQIKDDIIASKDDEITRLKQYCENINTQIKNVSELFTNFPQSVEDLEKIIIELEEYRKYCTDIEIKRNIKTKQLEYITKCHLGNKISKTKSTDLIDTTHSKSIERLKDLSSKINSFNIEF